MKNRKLKPNHTTNVRHRMVNKRSSGCKHRVALCFVRLCCFVFLVACLFIFTAGAKAKNEKQLSTENTSEVNDKLHLTTSLSSTVKGTNNPLMHQLQQARISYQVEKDSESKNELKQMTEQIRSILFRLREQPTKSTTVAVEAPAIGPNEAPSDTKVHEEPREIPVQPEPKNLLEPKRPYEPVTEYTLQMLENLTQKPDQLENPFELAEVLFLSGYAQKATVFYREALNRKDPNDLDSAQEKAWILFQIGNCLRSDDLQSAKNTYRQLIAEYPDYPWTDLAKAQEKLIDWYLKDKPHALIGECKQLVGGR